MKSLLSFTAFLLTLASCAALHAKPRAGLDLPVAVSSPASGTQEKVHLLLAKRDNLQFATFHAAAGAGCFPKQGVSFDSVVPPYQRGIIRAALAAKTEVALLPAPSLLEVLVQGGDWVVVANLLRNESVNLVVRPWCSAADYWTLRFDLTRGLKEALEEAGCSIPYPQPDVHLPSQAPPAA